MTARKPRKLVDPVEYKRVRLSMVRKLLKSIYVTWHNCGLRKAERGLKKGRLCDVCLEMVDEHIRILAMTEPGR